MKLKIAKLPGDGIGPEVVEQAVKAVDAVCARFGHEVSYTYGYVGACAIDRFGNAYPSETHALCMDSDAVLFGAVGDPRYDNDPTAKVRPELWSPENPRLYDISISSGADRLDERIGFRTIETAGEQILLNGKPVFLKGVAVHDESIGVNPGRCKGEEDVRALLEAAKDLGCNFLRLAHYPHSEQMVRLAEEMGFMLWEEIPCYWNIDWKSEETYANAERQLLEMIRRDRNRSATIIWSVANETPHTPERFAFLKKLIEKARAEDPTRLISAAIQKNKPDLYHPVIEDDLVELTDLVSFNQYVGWYDGVPADCDSVCWSVPRGKPVIISEFGGGALYGNHGSASEMFTEEYLELLYRKNLGMLSKIPGLAGLSPWCLKDFRSP